MKCKKKNMQKCHICFHPFERVQMNKHMDSHFHHEVMERLKGGKQRKRKKQKMMSAKVTPESQEAFQQKWQMMNMKWRTVTKRPSNLRNRLQGNSTFPYRSCGLTNPPCQGGVDFPFWQENDSHQSPSASGQQTKTRTLMQKKDQNRFDAGSSSSSRVRRRRLSQVSLKHERIISACGRPSTDEPRASELEQGVHKSLAEAAHPVDSSAGSDGCAVEGVGKRNSSAADSKSTPANPNRLQKSQHDHPNETLFEKTLPAQPVALCLSAKCQRPSSGSQAAEVFFKKKMSKAKKRPSPETKASIAMKKLATPSMDVQKMNEKVEQKDQGPLQTKQALPAEPSRSASKAGVRKPNLTLARDVLASRSNTMEESNLQKLMSSESSQLRVNWGKICQEAPKRNQEGEKVEPRFGTGLLSALASEPQKGAVKAVEKDLTLAAGLQWEFTSSHTAESQTVQMIPMGEDPCRAQSADAPPPPAGPGTQNQDGGTPSTHHALQPNDSAVLRNEQRRCGGISDVGGKEVETSNRITPPNMKVPTYEHVSELLAVSLREKHLSGSLKNTDGRLLQAQAAFCAAYVGALRLLVVRQQRSPPSERNA
ncbi:uncharacterized protein znf106b isoform X2 [Brachyhypopomus gauderio]|uniref:uncharacterized protein znf106b isoform X2 n=1 Tax=Brachyhypopomus gauderio TaxID=698409 RepID=UPI004042278A